MKNNMVVNENKNIIFLLTIGFLSAQRFTFSYISPYFSVLPLLLLAVFKLNKQRKDGLGFLIIASLASVDLGGGVYYETNIIIRFSIYVLILYSLIVSIQFKEIKKFIISIGVLGFYLINTLVHEPIYFTYQFYRDILILFVTLIVFNIKPNIDLHIKPETLLYFSIGMIFSECLNIIFWYRQESESYLNYSSLKFIVCVPILFMIGKRKNPFFILLSLPFVLLVIVNYNSRMLLLTLIFVSMIMIIGWVRIKFIVFFLLLALLQIISFEHEVLQKLETNRVYGMFANIVQSVNLFELLAVLDPVRFTENSLFFSQSVIDILFGQGIGAALNDNTGVLGNLADDGSSFSQNELLSSSYYVLHDSWLWFGLRFGLLSYVVVLTWGIKQCFIKNSIRSFWGGIFLLALFNSSFSIMGILITALFAIQIKNQNVSSQNSDINKY